LASVLGYAETDVVEAYTAVWRHYAASFPDKVQQADDLAAATAREAFLSGNLRVNFSPTTAPSAVHAVETAARELAAAAAAATQGSSAAGAANPLSPGGAATSALDATEYAVAAATPSSGSPASAGAFGTPDENAAYFSGGVISAAGGGGAAASASSCARVGAAGAVTPAPCNAVNGMGGKQLDFATAAAGGGGSSGMASVLSPLVLR
jgi:hypothetical protein